MATLVIKTVGPGKDYTTLAAFEAGEQTDISAATGNDTLVRAVCSNFEDTTVVSFSGWTTDESTGNYVDIVAEDVHSSVGAQTTDAYRLLAAGNVLTFSGLDIHLTGIQARSTNTTVCVSNSAANVLCTNCIFKGGGGLQSNNVGGSETFISCLLIAPSGVAYNQTAASGDMTAYSTTLVGSSIFWIGSGDVLLKNCYSFSFVNVGASSFVLVTCASVDTTGSPGLQNIPHSVTTFKSISGGVEDYRPVPGSPLLAAGTDTSGDPAPFNFTTDLIGDTRSSWTVASLEIAAPPATVVTKTVGPGKDYTSLVAFEAGEQRALPLLDEISRALCANFEDTAGPIVFTGWSTDEARYILIEAEDNHRSSGLITNRAYRLVRSQIGNLIENGEAHTRFVGIQAKNSSPSFAVSVFVNRGTDGILWDRCVGEIVSADAGADVFDQQNNGGIATMRNCLAYRPTAGRVVKCDDDILRIYSCTLIGSVEEIGLGNITCKNCYAAGRGNPAYSAGVNVAESNASDDATGNGAPWNLQNVPLDTTTFNDPVNRGFQLVAGSRLLNVGNDTSVEPFPLNFTDDLVQDSRVGWSVGALELVLGPPTLVTKTVGPSGDYTSLAAFESGEQRAITATNEILRAACANFQDGDTVFSGWITDATRFVQVVADDNHGSVGEITTNAYRIVSGGFQAINISNMDVELIGVQATSQNTTRTVVLSSFAGTTRAINCVLINEAAGDAASETQTADKIDLINCILKTTTGVQAFTAAGFLAQVQLYNCTCIGSVESGVSDKTVTVKNCYASAYVTIGGTILLTTSASADGSGSPGLQNVSQAAAFTNAPTDLTLKDPSPLLDTGTDTSAEPFPYNFTDDISQDPLIVRPVGSGWDIGAFEFPPIAPTAAFNASPPSGNFPLQVQFINASTGDDPSFLWIFGDGETSTEQNPVHTFTKPGEFKVTLVVTNFVGSDEFSRTISVDPGTPLVGPATWGALFLARTGDGLVEDRAAMEALGFTIFDDIFERAGHSEMYGHGPESAMEAVISDFDLKLRVHSFFFLLPEGEKLTASLVKKWTDGGLFF
jgi:hypothetical protein